MEAIARKKIRRQIAALSILILSYITIAFSTQSAEWVEIQYSSYLYPKLSCFLRSVFSVFRGSVGDLLYTLFALYILWRGIHFSRKSASLVSKKWSLVSSLIKVRLLICSVVIWFQLCWGINYHRKGIAYQLAMGNAKYTTADLIQLDAMLLDSMNISKILSGKNDALFLKKEDVFFLSEAACKKAVQKFPFLEYKYPAVKRSYYGWLGNYLGFTGYYNPFTGEAQVNTTIPVFLQPFVTCHEIAHQLGYAKENEANFVGYLMATQSSNSSVKYSAYLEMYLYTNRTLYLMDSVSAIRSRDKIHPWVKNDLEEWRRFNQSHVGFFEPLFTSMYDLFLKQHKQPSGIWSYDEAIGLLVSYLKKNGRI